MTLIISVTSAHGSWLAADRRYGPPVDKNFLGTKVCRIDTTNSSGHIAYFGTGAYVYRYAPDKPIELSAWLSRALRGKKLTQEQTMLAIAISATKRKIGSARLKEAQLFQWAGFVDGVPTLDSLGTHAWAKMQNLRTNQKSSVDIGPNKYGFARSQSKQAIVARGGSGATHLSDADANKLVELSMRASRSKKQALKVSAYLSSLIRLASEREGNETVSPECVVSMILPNKGGWSHEFDAEGKSSQSEILPTLSQGSPISDLMEAMLPIFRKEAAETRLAWKEGRQPPVTDVSATNNAISKISTDSDDSI